MLIVFLLYLMSSLYFRFFEMFYVWDLFSDLFEYFS